jgi:hypothetical protein
MASGFPVEIQKMMEQVSEKDRPFSRLEKRKSFAKGREAVSKSSLPPLVQSALYLYFDCFDEAHNLAQDHEGLIGNWLHAIVHRREPDPENSKYWYARVRIPAKVSQGIAGEALKILGAQPPKELEAFQKKMAKSSEWEPEVFVDLCDKFRKEDLELPVYRTLAHIQELEWRRLLDYLLIST